MQSSLQQSFNAGKRDTTLLVAANNVEQTSRHDLNNNYLTKVRSESLRLVIKNLNTYISFLIDQVRRSHFFQKHLMIRQN